MLSIWLKEKTGMGCPPSQSYTSHRSYVTYLIYITYIFINEFIKATTPLIQIRKWREPNSI